MSDMISFSVSMLDALADFLAAPPIIYLFGLVCFIFVCRAVRVLIR